MSQSILPDLQAALLCEDVRQEASGSQTLVGVINALPAPVLPARLFKLCLWTRWCGGKGRFRQESVILDCEFQEKEIAAGSVDFTLTGMEGHATNVHLYAGLEFKNHGIYHVEIRLDGEFKMRFALPVLKPQGSPPEK